MTLVSLNQKITFTVNTLFRGPYTQWGRINIKWKWYWYLRYHVSNKLTVISAGMHGSPLGCLFYSASYIHHQAGKCFSMRELVTSCSSWTLKWEGKRDEMQQEGCNLYGRYNELMDSRSYSTQAGTRKGNCRIFFKDIFKSQSQNLKNHVHWWFRLRYMN